jgi:predicted  nucleic acid-binding Zn-ribbon protein
MKTLLEQRIAHLANEINSLDTERQAMSHRDAEIEIRLHQIVGAIHELQQLITDLDHQSLEESQAFYGSDLDQSTHLSENDDLGNHLKQPTEIEKNNPPQS